MFTVQANHEDIRIFYSCREAGDFARQYAVDNKITTYVKRGASSPPAAAPVDISALTTLLKKQKTKAGAKAVAAAIEIVAAHV